MAGDWIKMRNDLHDDPAVFKLSALTKLDRFAVVGRLWAFWAWADKHAVDGRVDGASSLVVDDVVRHDGFAAALVAVNWLTVGEDHIAIPQHDRHNGESAKERGLKNNRQARWRAKSVDATPSTSESTQPSTREEKRREEITSKAKTTPKAVAPLALPDWLAQEDWERWRKHRGQKVTPQAAVLQIKKLDALRAAGHQPSAMIDLAIESSWATFWPPNSRAPPRSQTQAEKRAATAAAMYANRGENHAERDITSTATRVE